MRQVEGKLATELYEKAMVDGIKGNISETLKIVDD